MYYCLYSICSVLSPRGCVDSVWCSETTLDLVAWLVELMGWVGGLPCNKCEEKVCNVSPCDSGWGWASNRNTLYEKFSQGL